MARKPRSTFSVYEVYLKAEKGGGYTVECPTFPGCTARGADEAEALANAKRAIVEHLKHMTPLADQKSNRRFVIIETIE